MPSIKSGRFVTVLHRSDLDEGWDREALDRVDNHGFLKLTFPAEQADREINFQDESVHSVEITHNGYGIKRDGNYFWDLYSTWEEAKAAFDEMV